MTTQVCFPPQLRTALPKASSPQVSPEPKFHPLLSHATHTSLHVCRDAQASPLPDDIEVRVFDPSKNINIPFKVKSTDTAETLINKYLKSRPDMGKTLNLAYNGKPVVEQKSLRELGVKPGAVFITFQRCIGG